MATTVIIDGYNLLGARRSVRNQVSALSQSGREDLLRALATYRQRKGHAVLVVFDGWRTGSTLEQHDRHSGIEIVYSRRGERADQVIQRLAREYGTACAVVSSDHEVVDSARAAGALVISAAEFWGKLHAASPARDMPHFKELDLERDVSLGARAEKKGNPRKLPKSVRKRRKQLKGF